jgi:hypothetical protein
MEQQEISNKEVAVPSLRTCRSETAASQEDTETKPDPGKMQSVEEHQEIPKVEASRRTEEAAQGPESGRGAPPEAEGKDPSKL